MQHMTLTAESRVERGRKTYVLRDQGKLPGVVYGFGTEPVNITLDRNATEKAYKAAGESTVIALSVEGKEHNVLIQDLQRDPLTGFLTHADFRAIDMMKPVEAMIELVLVGEAPAVKELGGTLLQNLEEVEVKALPSALVHTIEVNVSMLKTFKDVVRVSDLTIPEGIEVLSQPTLAIAMVQEPRSEAEMAALDEAIVADVSTVEVTTEKKEAPEEAEKTPAK